MKKYLTLSLLFTALALASGYGMRVLAEGAPTTQPLFYSGTLEDDGELASGEYAITLTLYDNATSGEELCKSETEAAQVSAGRFRVEVDEDCVAALEANPDAWTAVAFTGEDGTPHNLSGRTKIGAVPYALEAQHAVTATSALTSQSATEATHSVGSDRATSAATADRATQADAPRAGGAIDSRLTALEEETKLSEPIYSSLSASESDSEVAAFATPCMQNPTTAVFNCMLAANRKCIALSYSAGWYVGECASIACTGRSIVCIR